VTAVYDAAAQTLALSVNGVLEGTLTGRTLFRATGGLYVGRSQSGAHWAGSLSDIRLWNRVLSTSEITDLSNPLTDNVGQWHMDEGSGPTAFDSSNFFHDVNLNLGGGVSWTTDSQSGAAALTFNHAGDAKTDGPVLYTDQSFTVSAWVRMADEDLTDAGPTLPTNNRTALSQKGNRVSGFYLGYRLDTANVPHWAFSIPEADVDLGNDANAPGWWVTALSTNPVTTADIGRWAHLIGVYDANTSAMRLYVNGTLAGTITRTQPRWNVTGPLTVGAAWWSPAGGPPAPADAWRGSVDNVNVYQGAVPPSAIAQVP
jgi:hypothetical protein